MQLNTLKPNTKRKKAKRVGRGGKRGTYSGKGTKGQKSRAGAGVKPGFRGGDNRIWQLFPKQRGASKKPGSKRPHRKHRFYQLRSGKALALNLDDLNRFSEGQRVNRQLLVESGLIADSRQPVKILGNGTLKKKLEFEGLEFSESAKEKISKAGGVIVG
ncbi:MAG TPA: 50S ribosomal protein L15 [Candidatus Paceibacterota bacterium]|nr:50S ribosomal protein L15 [Candidatus Paceibacterota bacterium]